MPKALITMEGGATVTVEGTQEEVAALLARFENGGRGKAAASRDELTRSAKRRTTPMGLVSELDNEGFFRTPKGLGTIRQALEERGHYYPVTTLSPVMLRLVKKRRLRRLKQGNVWTYVE
jgi:hypothetical protein